MVNKKKIVDEAQALIEMYKAGFLDGYTNPVIVQTNAEWAELNNNYKKAFDKRFGKQITKELKKKEKK